MYPVSSRGRSANPSAVSPSAARAPASSLASLASVPASSRASLALLLAAALFGGCRSKPHPPDHPRTGCEDYAFADDRSALASFDGDWLLVRTASGVARVKRPRCLMEMVERLEVSPGGKTVAAFALSAAGGPSRLACFLEVATGKIAEPPGAGLLSWIGDAPVLIPQDQLPLPMAQCRAFATAAGPVAVCLGDHPAIREPGGDASYATAGRLQIRRFRGVELAPWGDELSVLVRKPGIGDLERLHVSWDGRLVTWSDNQVRLVELGEREAKVRELGDRGSLLEPTWGEIDSVELEPGGRRLMVTSWQSDDRFPRPLGHLRLASEDGEVLRTVAIDDQRFRVFWSEPAAIWLMHECGGDRLALPERDGAVITPPRQ